MSVIQVEIEDRLIQEIGTKTVKTFMEHQIDLLRVQYLGEKIARAIQHAGINHAQEIQEAREEAWQEYKESHRRAQFYESRSLRGCPKNNPVGV